MGAIQWGIAIPVVLMAALLAYISAPHYYHHHHHQIIPSSPSKVTSLFVFGDDTVDAGNVDFRLSKHYGPVNCPVKLWRMSDGRCLADLIAENFNLPYIRPHFDRDGRPAKYTEYGINFASSGCGIDKNTKPHAKWYCKPLSSQVEAFIEYVKAYSKVDLNKSLALISIGQNDVFYPHNIETSRILDDLKRDIKNLVTGGLKNILITNMPPLGCYPALRSLSSSNECHNGTNALVQDYNERLFCMVGELKTDFSDLSIRLVDMHRIVQEAVARPSSVGMTNVEYPCCEVVDGGCRDCSAICEDKTKYMFFDKFHVTERVYELAFIHAKIFSSLG